jgi:hypothetical protein
MAIRKPVDPVVSQLRKKNLAGLRQMAHDLGLPVCSDFTKSDLVDLLTERMCADLEGSETVKS